MNPGQDLRQKARDLGFDLVGITPAVPPACAPALHQALAAGYLADMNWMARGAGSRAAPAKLLKGLQSIVVVGQSCRRVSPPVDLLEDPLRARFAAYAWGNDYHEDLLGRIEELAAFLRHRWLPAPDVRAYVDTGPVLERHFAARAGLGFIGRNTMLISPEKGSHVLLGVLLVAAELDYDPPALAGCAPEEKAHPCGRCSRCLAACPTGALARPFQLDARRCISYLTIEHRGSIPEEFRAGMKNWVFGCDQCQDICPWTRRAAGRMSGARASSFDADRWAPRLEDLLRLDDAEFMVRYAGTTVQRTGRIRLQRNALVALGNSGRPEAREWLKPLCSTDDPVLAEHARWALQRLSPSQREAASGYSKHFTKSDTFCTGQENHPAS